MSFHILLLLAAQMDLNTYFDPPTYIPYTIQSPTPPGMYASTSNAWFAGDLLWATHRACMIWRRTGDVGRRCSALGLGTVADEPDHSQNNVNEIHFDVATNNGAGGDAWCHFFITPATSECDFWLQGANAPSWSTYLNNAGSTQCTPSLAPCASGASMLNINTGGQRQGFISGANYLPFVLMHEMGHTLGLFHPICDATQLDCSMMAQSANRVSYWPNYWDTQVLRSRYGVGARPVQFAQFAPVASGAMTETVAWTTIPNFQNNAVVSRVPPRVSCRPAGVRGQLRAC